MILAQGAVDAAPEKPRIVVVGDDDRNENPVGCRMSHGTHRAAFMGMDTAPHRRTPETGASARGSARARLSPRRTQRKKIRIKRWLCTSVGPAHSAAWPRVSPHSQKQ